MRRGSVAVLGPPVSPGLADASNEGAGNRHCPTVTPLDCEYATPCAFPVTSGRDPGQAPTPPRGSGPPYGPLPDTGRRNRWSPAGQAGLRALPHPKGCANACRRSTRTCPCREWRPACRSSPRHARPSGQVRQEGGRRAPEGDRRRPGHRGRRAAGPARLGVAGGRPQEGAGRRAGDPAPVRHVPRRVAHRDGTGQGRKAGRRRRRHPSPARLCRSRAVTGRRGGPEPGSGRGRPGGGGDRSPRPRCAGRAAARSRRA